VPSALIKGLIARTGTAGRPASELPPFSLTSINLSGEAFAASFSSISRRLPERPVIDFAGRGVDIVAEFMIGSFPPRAAPGAPIIKTMIANAKPFRRRALRGIIGQPTEYCV